MRQKIEIMHFEQGKLCVTNIELCAKLFYIKEWGQKKSSLTFVHILTEFYLT